ncbi:MAG: hypothetical protein RIT45_1982 [Pseudomonadota bacterium]
MNAPTDRRTGQRRTSRQQLDALLGETIDDDLVIERPLGSGSHADVFLARQRSIGDRRVALKVLARPYLQLREADFRRGAQALGREAAVLGLMRAHCFVQVHRIGVVPDGRPYVVLEHVDGPPLATHVADNARLPVETVVDIARQIATGLHEMHQRGFVHRDVTPANFLLGTDPLGVLQVKLIDFGTATRISERADRYRVGYDLEHPLGTAGYMAPEQARGDVVDGRADQFGLAGLCWELLYGVRATAIITTTQRSMLEFLRSDAPIPTAPPPRDSGVPPALEQTLRRALSRDPAARFESMREFAEALGEALASQAPRGGGRLLGRLFGGRGGSR